MRLGPIRLGVAAILLWGVLGGHAHAADPLSEARSLSRDGKTTEALEVLRGAASGSQGRELARVLNAQGWLYYTQGLNRRALALFQDALVNADRSGDTATRIKIRNNIGLVYFSMGDLERAKDAFVRAKEIGSALARKYLDYISIQEREQKFNQYVRGGIEHRLHGDFEKAIEQYDLALEIDRDSVKVLEYRGYAFFRVGRLDRALDDLRAAYRLDPTRTNTKINLIKVYCDAGGEAGLRRFVESIKPVDRDLLKRMSEDYELLRVCGDSLAALGIDRGRSKRQ